MTSLDELERLAQEATPGPWHRGDSDEHDWFVAGTAGKAHPECQVWAREPVNATTTAAYIAALSPDVVLNLIAKARLGEAWARAEAALPEGAAMVRLTWRIGMHEKFPPDEDYEARAEWWDGLDRPVRSAFGSTPEAALDALVSELER